MLVFFRTKPGKSLILQKLSAPRLMKQTEGTFNINICAFNFVVHIFKSDFQF